MKPFLLVLALLSAAPCSARDFNPNEIYADEDACPGEWCGFGNWTATKEIPVYAQPKSKEQSIAVINKGQTVKALTGIAYVKPQKYFLSKDTGGEEVIWVLTYQGEGFFRVWRDGKVQDMELGFSPYGPDIFLPYEEDWWVKFELPDGTIGWARAKGGFKDDKSE